MGKQTSSAALVAVAMSQHAAYTAPVLGDKVAMSADYEVALATDDAFVIGEVIAIETAADNKVAQVTVELKTAKIDRVTASGAGINAGSRVVSAGSNAFRLYTSGNEVNIYGIALQAAADTEDFDVAVL
jgi:hypothetical protein